MCRDKDHGASLRNVINLKSFRRAVIAACGLYNSKIFCAKEAGTNYACVNNAKFFRIFGGKSTKYSWFSGVGVLVCESVFNYILPVILLIKHELVSNFL